jgi:hypothetical protein
MYEMILEWYVTIGIILHKVALTVQATICTSVPLRVAFFEHGLCHAAHLRPSNN